jgi:hypothetical protein
MTDPDDTILAKIDQPYSDDELREIKRVLGIKRFTNPIRKRLEYAAKLYLVERETERPSKAGEGWLYPPRSVRRAAYKEVAKKARELKGALEVTGFTMASKHRFPEEKETWPEFDLEQLEALAQAAETAASKVPKTGADPRTSRREFIKRLVPIFEEVTEEKAARSHDPLATPTARDTGPFLEFVEKCLRPLTSAGADSGLDDDVRRALKEMSPGERS